MEERIIALIRERANKWNRTRNKTDLRWLALRGLVLIYLHLLWYETSHDHDAPIQFGEGESRDIPSDAEVRDVIPMLLRHLHPRATTARLEFEVRDRGQRGLRASVKIPRRGGARYTEDFQVESLWLLVGDRALGIVARMLHSTAKGRRSILSINLTTELSTSWKCRKVERPTLTTTAEELDTLAQSAIARGALPAKS